MTTWTKIGKASGTSWTKISKPASAVNTTVAGSPIGLLLALTYSTTSQSGGTSWTNITKASGTSWTKISKAV